MAVLCRWVLSPVVRLKNLKDVDKWSSLNLCLSVGGNVSHKRAWTLLVYSRVGSNSALSPVVHGDIMPSINTNTKIK